MGIKFSIRVLLCFLFTALVFLPYTRSSRDVGKQAEDETDEFSYEEWSDKGPSHWGDLRPDWFRCKNGTMQSPIALLDLSAQLAPNLGRLQTNYRPSNATLKNRGHDIMLEWDAGGGPLLINGTQYVLQQCHWHSPSEHTINGIRYPLEIHMVHESAEGRIAVIGMLYRIGRADSFLAKLTDSIRAIFRMPGAERDVGTVDPNQININMSEGYYRYMGSLTVPPCDEGIIWTVKKELATVSPDQVRLLRGAVYDKSNARPLQPLNNRTVQLYVPRFF